MRRRILLFCPVEYANFFSFFPFLSRTPPSPSLPPTPTRTTTSAVLLPRAPGLSPSERGQCFPTHKPQKQLSPSPYPLFSRGMGSTPQNAPLPPENRTRRRPFFFDNDQTTSPTRTNRLSPTVSVTFYSFFSFLTLLAHGKACLFVSFFFLPGRSFSSQHNFSEKPPPSLCTRVLSHTPASYAQTPSPLPQTKPI